MMKGVRSFLIIGLLTMGLSGVSQQFSSDIFHKGFLVTVGKDTLKGNLKYDLENNIVTILSDKKAKSFSSQRVFYFEIFDNVLNNYRQFYSILYNVSYNYKIPVFFEVVYEDKLSLLRREQIVTQTVNTTAAYWGGGSRTQNVIKYSYYFLDEKGSITFFSGKKKDLFRIMSSKQSRVRNFIKDNKLRPDDLADLVRITAFYNSI